MMNEIHGLKVTYDGVQASLENVDVFSAYSDNIYFFDEDTERKTSLTTKGLEWDTKLTALSGAQPNKIESLTRNGVALPISNKTIEVGNAGHQILNNEGTAVIPRDRIQFKNFKIADNGTTGTTVITGNSISMEETNKIATIKIAI